MAAPTVVMVVSMVDTALAMADMLAVSSTERCDLCVLCCQT